MRIELYENLYKSEQTYWWFQGQRFLIGKHIQRFFRDRRNLRILDVGCGTGANMEFLARFGDVSGIDVSDLAVQFCKRRGIAIKKSDAMQIEYDDSSFDAVTVFGVFYHKAVTDDQKALQETYRVLKPGGRLFLFEPAMMCLYGTHTEAFDGIRRYSRQELNMKLQTAGFQVQKLTYVTTLFFPIVYAHRKIAQYFKFAPKSDIDDSLNPTLNRMLAAIYKAELSLTTILNYPFGVNIFAVASR